LDLHFFTALFSVKTFEVWKKTSKVQRYFPLLHFHFDVGASSDFCAEFVVEVGVVGFVDEDLVVHTDGILEVFNAETVKPPVGMNDKYHGGIIQIAIENPR
jgi:hypothetical protein